jgi:microcystin-dependent protein
MPYAGSSVEDGWLLCDGSLISDDVYPDLCSLLQSTYGAQVGTSYRLPDLRGRVPVGLDNMGGTDAGRLSVANTRGGSGGAETHTLTSAQIPAHSHPNTLSSATVASSTHKHAEGNLATAIGAVNSNPATLGYQASASQPSGRGPASVSSYVLQALSVYDGFYGPLPFNHYTRVYGDTSNNATTTTVGITNQNNTDGGGPHNNMQPYLLINYIIKT